MKVKLYFVLFFQKLFALFALVMVFALIAIGQTEAVPKKFRGGGGGFRSHGGFRGHRGGGRGFGGGGRGFGGGGRGFGGGKFGKHGEYYIINLSCLIF